MINIKQNKAFTIVELLVVIVIIGILASITIVSYSNISSKAIAVSLQSDLSSDAKLLKMYNVDHGYYPDSIAANYCPDVPDADVRYCLKASAGNTLTYEGGGQSFTLTATNTNGMSYSINESGTIAQESGASGGNDGTRTSVISQISAGGDHTCIINNESKVFCWGGNYYGELGSNYNIESALPIAVDTSGILNGLTIKSIFSGSNHSCAIASNDSAYCWGGNDNGELGNNLTAESMAPVAVDMSGVLNGLTIKKITGGYDHTCAIASDNNAYCWGLNDYGQLGDNSINSSSVPIAVDKSGALSGLTIKSISAGSSHTCAIASDNNAYCWGYGDDGELGNNTAAGSLIPVTVDRSGVLSGLTIKTISSGDYHTCAVASNNNAYCWGYGDDGELGNNTPTSSSIPVAVDKSGALNSKTVKYLVSASAHSCVITTDNNTYCWGDNSQGAIGNGTFTSSSVPVAVRKVASLSGLSVKSISAGALASCAIASNDKLYCWGTYKTGEVGYNAYAASLEPIPVYSDDALSGLTVKSVSSGNYHTCAIASDNNAYCWGFNNEGQVGNNTTARAPAPVAVYKSGSLNGLTIKSISSSKSHVCAVASDNNAYCWGYGGYYQLGNNSGTNSSVPVAVYRTGVLNGLTIKAIAAGYYHTCAIASNNNAYCWGMNFSSGDIGDGTTNSTKVPVAVVKTGVLNGLTLKSIAVGDHFSCAIASDDNGYCWGQNDFGQLGSGSTDLTSLVPVAINKSGALSGLTLKSISAGEKYACAIASNDNVYCWGGSDEGEIGNNSTTGSLVPVAVNKSGALSGLTVKDISSGPTHTCVIASDNNMYCWGRGTDGVLGDGKKIDSLVPVAVKRD